MIIQISSSLTKICNFFVTLPEPIYASSSDYGFDFDANELAEELIAPLPVGLADQPIREVNADEFEKAFQYFCS